MLGVWFGALCWQQHFRLFSDGPQLKVPSVADALQWTVNTDVASCWLVGLSHACVECTFRHTVSRCGPQAVKQTITWVPMTGLRLWNRPLPGFPWRAWSCETNHYLGSHDGPQAVKQTITWVPMTDLKLWNRRLSGFPWRASRCETDHYLGSHDGLQAVKQTITWVPMTGDLVRPLYLTGQYVCKMNLETFNSVLGRLNRNINNDDTNETVYKTRRLFNFWNKKLFNCQLAYQYTTESSKTLQQS